MMNIKGPIYEKLGKIQMWLAAFRCWLW